jgi:hypothetical protein
LESYDKKFGVTIDKCIEILNSKPEVKVTSKEMLQPGSTQKMQRYIDDVGMAGNIVNLIVDQRKILQ